MKGDLSSLLLSKEKVEWSTRMSLLLDVAKAICYLHSMTIPIVHRYTPSPLIHRDIKSLNILVDEQMNGKLSDFGTAVPKTEMGTTIVGTGTISHLFDLQLPT